MSEILDDQSDHETYYLTVEFYDLLKINLKAMVTYDKYHF